MAHLTPPPSKGNTPLRPGSSSEPAPSPTRIRSALSDLSQPGQPTSASGSRSGLSAAQASVSQLPTDQMDVDSSEILVSPSGAKEVLVGEDDELSEDDDTDAGGSGGIHDPIASSSESEEEEQGVVDVSVVFGSDEEEEFNGGIGQPPGQRDRADVKGKGPASNAKGGKNKKGGKGKGGKGGLGEGRGKENELYEADIVNRWNNRFGDVVWDADHPKPPSKRA